MKTCKKCNCPKPIDDFYIKDKKTGRRSTLCKSCDLIREKKRRATPEFKSAKRAYRKNRYHQDIKYKNKVLLDNHLSRLQIRNNVLDKYGGKCVCCGENKFEFLSIDHINGGGSKEFLKIGHSAFLRKLNNYPLSSDYRVLCRNCNQSLGYYGYCPHDNGILRAKPDIVLYSSDWQRRYSEIRKDVINLYGSKCECCNESYYEFLAIDHVFGNGREERKEITGRPFLVSLLKVGKKQPNYRLLCHNCNSSFGYYNRCPHSKE